MRIWDKEEREGRKDVAEVSNSGINEIVMIYPLRTLSTYTN
jgi:hypothetical protein